MSEKIAHDIYTHEFRRAWRVETVSSGTWLAAHASNSSKNVSLLGERRMDCISGSIAMGL